MSARAAGSAARVWPTADDCAGDGERGVGELGAAAAAASDAGAGGGGARRRGGGVVDLSDEAIGDTRTIRRLLVGKRADAARKTAEETTVHGMTKKQNKDRA